MTKFEKIKEIIKEYMEKSDKHYARYKAEEEKARAKYSEEGFKEEFMHGTWVTMAGQAWANADSAINEIGGVFDEIVDDFNRWVMKPLDAGTIQVLDCIGNFGLNLSLNELQVIENSVRDSYFGTRIFSGLAEKNGYGVKIPNMKEYMDELKMVRDSAEFTIRAYAGRGAEGFPGRDLLQNWEYNGVDFGEYHDHHLTMSEGFLESGGIDHLEAMWNSAQAPMRYVLTEAETEKVKKSISEIVGENGEIDKEAARNLQKREPDIKNKLESMPDGSLEEMDSIAQYFGLKEEKRGKAQDSKIDESTQSAAQYADRKLGTVNMDILGQF